MQLLHLLLRIEEALRNRVAEKLLPHLFKGRPLLGGHFESVALLHLQQLAKIVNLLELELQKLIRYEGVELLLYVMEVRLLDDRLK